MAADAIRTAFHPTTPGFAGLIDRFLAEREQLLKGPYVSVALPFHQGTGRNWFPEIPLSFPPYRHQEKAFECIGDRKYKILSIDISKSPLAMPRPRYRQDPLPIGPAAPPVELFGPEQPNPPGLELMQQMQLEVVPLGPLFDGQGEAVNTNYTSTDTQAEVG